LSVGTAILLSGCASSAPQDTLKPSGPFSRQIDNLFRWPFWIAVGIFTVVEGLIVFAVFRFRRRSEDDAPKQVHGNTRLEMTWTAIPLMILLAIGVPTIGTVFSLARQPGGNPLTVDVIGHQWWWEFRYEGTNVVTATELHIPVNTPVYLKLTSADVVHSFWIPQLNGKRDVIPGELQTTKLQADKVGTYYGQCVEFCGASHANMRDRAVVQTQSDFDAWLRAQEQAAVTPAKGGAADQGLALFQAKGCSGCHTVSGVSQGLIGPNLTHLQSRSVFAGGIFALNPENLATWLRNPPGEKPGSIMPNLHLTEDEIAKLVAYLGILK
jgi:cytochrome c oxidase subunit 2